MMFGPHMIVDMSLLPLLRPSEWCATGRHIRKLHHKNRLCRFPFHFIFAGCDREHVSWADINNRYFPNGIDSHLFTVTELDYLDIFPREQLVYLSPDAPLTLTEYDPEKVYIVAALADELPRPRLTLRRATADGIETRRLPVEKE